MQTRPILPTPRRGWLQRAVWLLDSYGRALTVAALVGAAVSPAAFLTAVIHGATRLTLPWVIVIGASVAVFLMVVGALAVVTWLGGRIVVAQEADMCWVDQGGNPAVTQLTGTVLLTNTDPDWVVHPVQVRVRDVEVDGRKSPGEFQARLRLITREDPLVHPGEIARYGFSVRGLTATNYPENVEAKIDVQDQFLRWSRGRRPLRFPRHPGSRQTATTPGNTGSGRPSS